MEGERATKPARGRMRRSYHLATDQLSLQRNWSLYRQRRHREYATKSPPGARLVKWSAPVNVRCGRCRHVMGACVAYRVDDQYGLVEDTARWTLERSSYPAPLKADPGRRPHWMRIDGSGREALVYFRCQSCRNELQPRNAHRRARQAFLNETSEMVLR